jgi:MFS family permease
MAVTYSLLAKFVGAVVFGIAADSMGRKYPMIVNCFFLGLCQLATTFTTSLRTFQMSRISVGIAMGGIWGNAAASALEHINSGARGTLSGVFESAGGAAFMLANLINLKVGGETETWKISFYVR